MKLLTAQQIKDWDAYTIKHKPIASIDLMEHAATLCFNQIVFLVDKKKITDNFKVFCGTGNNGGDGLVIAKLLAQNNFKVEVYVLDNPHKSEDFIANFIALETCGINITTIKQISILVEPNQPFSAIDALFGTGLNKPLEGVVAEVAEFINNYATNTISVDIPSGLPAEVYTTEEFKNKVIVKADYTLTFQAPKQSFLFADTYQFVGNFIVLDIGLLPSFLDTLEVNKLYLTTNFVKSILKPKSKFSHKGTNGHALVAGGSFGKMGAVILSAKAVLRSGCGLVTVFIPKVGYTILQTALPEAMVITDDELYVLRNFPNANNYSAIGVGIGLGTDNFTKTGLLNWFKTIHKPIVIDADAINICAVLLQENNDFKFPNNVILTPHPKEFDRLVGFCNNALERYQKQIALSKKHHIIVVLKGAHTCITLPNGKSYFNSSGNYLLATAGSGDVLTGIITSFLAQGYSIENAAILGVFLHGYCANILLNQNATIIASDITDVISKALYDIAF